MKIKFQGHENKRPGLYRARGFGRGVAINGLPTSSLVC